MDIEAKVYFAVAFYFFGIFDINYREKLRMKDDVMDCFKELDVVTW